MEPFPEGTDLAALIDSWRSERDGSPYTAILLRRVYCDDLHPMPERCPRMVYEAVLEARAQCMRERPGYQQPLFPPPSRRFPGASAYGAHRQSSAHFVCASCKRWVASRVRSVCGDLPRVVYCECGPDRMAGRRMNDQLREGDAASRGFWAEQTGKMSPQLPPRKNGGSCRCSVCEEDRTGVLSPRYRVSGAD